MLPLAKTGEKFWTTMTQTLQDKRVLIVGGARGIGFSVGKAAAFRGATVIVGASDFASALAAASDISDATPVEIDISCEESIATALDQVVCVDHVVVSPLADDDSGPGYKKLDMAFDARVAALTRLARHAAKYLPPDGSIALCSGGEAWSSTQGQSNMAAGDAAAFLAGRLATAFAPIRVNAVSPSSAISGSLSAFKAEQDRESRHNAAHGPRHGRTLANDDIVKAVLWLMGASFVNGVTIHVDGGARFAA